MSDGPEIVVTGRFEFDPEVPEAARQAMEAMQAASRAEDGCQDYTFSIEISDPAVVRLTERWDDMEALRRHFAMPHMQTYRQAMGAHPPISRSVEFQAIERVEPPTA
ncbi:MAG: putative quinol monooxygenase [Actinomycetota bacterium]